MKKIFFLFISGLLLAALSVSAQNKTDVRIKSSKQNSTARIVLEAEETFVQRIKVTTSSNQIKLDFPGPFSLTGQKDIPFEITVLDRSLIINIKDKGETKFFKLSAPARLVLDIGKKEVQAPKDVKSEKKPEVPAEKQPEKTAEKPPVNTTKIIVIDAGHGGYDFGITNGNVSEKDISLALSKDLATAFSKKGRKVFLLRRVDQYIPISERITLVNQKAPDVFISLHASTSRNFVLYGPKFEDQASSEATAFYSLSMKQKKYAAKSKSLSDLIEKALGEEFKAEVIRREMPVPLINSVGAPSVLIEYPSPKLIVYDQQMKSRVVNALLKGISVYGQ